MGEKIVTEADRQKAVEVDAARHRQEELAAAPARRPAAEGPAKHHHHGHHAHHHHHSHEGHPRAAASRGTGAHEAPSGEHGHADLSHEPTSESQQPSSDASDDHASSTGDGSVAEWPHEASTTPDEGATTEPTAPVEDYPIKLEDTVPDVVPAYPTEGLDTSTHDPTADTHHDDPAVDHAPHDAFSAE